MRKILITIALFTIISSSLCKQYWQCDSAGKHTCSKTQTCCRSKVSSTGWACFEIQNGVCCSDGKSVCPPNTICNLREMKCEAKLMSHIKDL